MACEMMIGAGTCTSLCESFRYMYFLCFAVDVDECATMNGGCDDLCTNDDGSFSCSCTSSGFMLGADGRSCEGKNFLACVGWK